MKPQMLYPLQLLDVRLFEAVVKRIVLDGTASAEPADSEHIANPFLMVDADVVRHNGANKVSVFLTVEIKGPEAKRPEFHLRFTLEGFFESSVAFDEIDEATWQEFEQTSSITLLWPYAREYTHSFSRRMRVDLPVLPTLNRLAMQAIKDSPSHEPASLAEKG